MASAQATPFPYKYCIQATIEKPGGRNRSVKNSSPLKKKPVNHSPLKSGLLNFHVRKIHLPLESDFYYASSHHIYRFSSGGSVFRYRYFHYHFYNSHRHDHPRRYDCKGLLQQIQKGFFVSFFSIFPFINILGIPGNRHQYFRQHACFR